MGSSTLKNLGMFGTELRFDMRCWISVAALLAGCTTVTPPTATSIEKVRPATANVTLAINPAGGTSTEAGLSGYLAILNGCVIASDTPAPFVTLIFPRGTAYDVMTSSVTFADGRRIGIGQRFRSSGYSETFNSAADAKGSGWHEGCPLIVFYVNEMEKRP